jgi:DNA-directed RNA polymerase subunit RPC12/RpoP
MYHHGSTKEEPLIKFFCLNCGKKLAVDDAAVDAVVSCTNCAEFIVVPPHSVSQGEFSRSKMRADQVVPGGMELIRPHADGAESNSPLARAALIPHLARMMMNRLVQALFAQRSSLLDAQAEATQRMTELEERIAKAQVAVQKKLAAYESRIADLEEQLIAKERENHQLRRANFQLSRKAGEVEGAAASRRVSLRDAGFLLHA